MGRFNTSGLRPSGGKHSYIAGLDGLRAIAVGTVFLGHAFPNVFANAPGVDMFFALSGFLITRGLLAQLERNGRINLKSFYLRRAMRLIPALVLLISVLLIVAIVLRITLNDLSLKQHIEASATALAYLMNWSRAFNLGPSCWLGHTWSLSVEEQFYLLWPLVLLTAYKFGGTKNSLRCTWFLALLSVSLRLYMHGHGATEDRLYNGFDTRADCLLIGCALALTRPEALSRWAARLWPVAFVAIAWIFLFVPWRGMDTLSSTVLAAACAWLILPMWTQASPGLVRALEFGPVRYIGRISYGLYLWHWPVLMILWQLNFARNSPATALLAGTISLLSAAASFHFVEQPILRLKEKIGSPVPVPA